MTLCYQCKFAPVNYDSKTCVQCLQRHGYTFDGSKWIKGQVDERDCRDCANFPEFQGWTGLCENCREYTPRGIIKHNFTGQGRTSLVDAFDGEKREITIPNTSSLSDRVQRHSEICKGLTDLYERKNHDYGDSFHKTFLEEGFAMSRIRLSDKLERFKSLTKSGEQKVNDESIVDTLKDMANYAIMTVLEIERGDT
jgi:hypothetical protein